MNDDMVPRDDTRQASAAAEPDEALRASEARFRAVLESAIDYAIITLDCDGLITGWSPGAERLLLWTEANAVGQPGATVTRRSGSWTGSSRIKSALTRLNIAAFAPMPSASNVITASECQVVRLSMRAAWRISRVRFSA